MLKLYRCDVIEDCEFETVLVVAESEEDAEKQVENMEWSCFMGAFFYEIESIGRHKTIIQ